MTQASPTIGANKSGLVYRQEDNDGKRALLNHHKGTSPPSYAEAGVLWLNDSATPWLLKIHDGTDWITLGAVNASTNKFQPYNGAAQTVCDLTESSIASAATTDLGSLATNTALITGTTAITSFGSSAATDRPVFVVRFSGALTLTHNATSLILPSAANIATANGDSLIAEYLGSGNWKVLGYFKASGKPVAPIAAVDLPAGTLVQTVSADYTSNADLTTALPVDDTIPQSTEGTQIISTSITPKSTTNKLRIRFRGLITKNGTGDMACALFNGGAGAIIAGYAYSTGASLPVNINMECEYTPGSTSPITFSVRVGAAAGTARMNGTATSRFFGGVSNAIMVIEEIVA